MKKLLLIDSHALIHRMFHAMAPLTTPATPEQPMGEPIGAVYGLAGLTLKIMTETIKPDYVAACFDRPEPTFRKDSFDGYKAQRAPAHPDLIPQFNKCREMFEKFRIKIFEMPGFEADDLIGTLATRLKDTPDLQIIVLSGDRDLLQLVEDDKVVCHMLQPSGGDTTYYNEAKVIEKYGLKPKQIIDLKGLIGDTSDNFPGLKGVGEKTATPLLQEFGTVEGIYENLVIVPEKTAKKFTGQLDVALKYKKLATLDCNAPLFLDSVEDVRAIPLDKEALKKYFTELGFVSLLRRL